MINNRIKLATLALCFCAGNFYSGTVNAQTLTQAKKWFTDCEFEKAKPVFEKLVKQSPSNASYNFWYGACCYETGELLKGLPYLEKSADRKVINAYLYVGKAYYDLYRFDDAISSLEEHIYWLEKKNRDTAEAEELMTKFRKGARMIRGVENITVVDSFVVDKERFLEAYKLSPQAGTVNSSYIDGKNGKEVVTEYINEMEDKKVLTSQLNDSTLTLKASIKLINEWSTPKLISGIREEIEGAVSETQNINFPFLDSDGTTLYFSADGGESLGGYDIFVTRADSEENSYFKPDNLGYPFNSQFNDYMYVIDDYSNLGWFASDRYQPEGKVCVYVFVPNDSRVVYNYEGEDPEKMISLAKLDNISITQADSDVLAKAKQRLAQVTYKKEKSNSNKEEFRFIINDDKIYTSLNDFRNQEAKKLFMDYTRMCKDLQNLESELKDQRITYSKATSSRKQELSPAIIDKEKRVEQLRNEINRSISDIRKLELN